MTGQFALYDIAGIYIIGPIGLNVLCCKVAPFGDVQHTYKATAQVLNQVDIATEYQ